MSSFGFVQFELPGASGPDDGRYPLRAPDGGTEAVLAVRSFGAAPPPRRRLRRPRPKPADPGEEPRVPLTELTVIDAEPLAGDPDRWLEGLRRDHERRDALVAGALRRANRALAAHRVASADPAVTDLTLASALAVRVGHGSGDELADGHWTAALDVPRDARRQGRLAALRPQERIARLLAGRERPLACEEALLRARADADAGRGRDAALQLRVALEALLAERGALAGEGQAGDLAELASRRRATGEAANEALRGPLAPEREREVETTLAICERVLRRRAAYG